MPHKRNDDQNEAVSPPKKMEEAVARVSASLERIERAVANLDARVAVNEELARRNVALTGHVAPEPPAHTERAAGERAVRVRLGTETVSVIANACTFEMRAELGPAVPLARREVAEIRNDSLPRSAGRAIRLDKRPIRVSLTALSSLASSQQHRSTPSLGCFEDRRREDKNSRTRSSLQRHSGNGALSLQHLRSLNGPKIRKTVSKCVTWASARPGVRCGVR